MAEAIHQILITPDFGPSEKAKIFQNFRNYVRQVWVIDWHHGGSPSRNHDDRFFANKNIEKLFENGKDSWSLVNDYKDALNALFDAIRSETGQIHLEGI